MLLFLSVYLIPFLSCKNNIRISTYVITKYVILFYAFILDKKYVLANKLITTNLNEYGTTSVNLTISIHCSAVISHEYRFVIGQFSGPLRALRPELPRG